MQIVKNNPVHSTLRKRKFFNFRVSFSKPTVANRIGDGGIVAAGVNVAPLNNPTSMNRNAFCRY